MRVQFCEYTPVNDESQSANVDETHTHRRGQGEVGHPFHDVEKSQMVDSMSALASQGSG